MDRWIKERPVIAKQYKIKLKEKGRERKAARGQWGKGEGRGRVGLVERKRSV